jgi:hypothetical protein
LGDKFANYEDLIIHVARALDAVKRKTVDTGIAP